MFKCFPKTVYFLMSCFPGVSPGNICIRFLPVLSTWCSCIGSRSSTGSICLVTNASGRRRGHLGTSERTHIWKSSKGSRGHPSTSVSTSNLEDTPVPVKWQTCEIQTKTPDRWHPNSSKIAHEWKSNKRTLNIHGAPIMSCNDTIVNGNTSY